MATGIASIVPIAVELVQEGLRPRFTRGRGRRQFIDDAAALTAVGGHSIKVALRVEDEGVTWVRTVARCLRKLVDLLVGHTATRFRRQLENTAVGEFSGAAGAERAKKISARVEGQAPSRTFTRIIFDTSESMKHRLLILSCAPGTGRKPHRYRRHREPFADGGPTLSVIHFVIPPYRLNLIADHCAGEALFHKYVRTSVVVMLFTRHVG